MILFVHSVQAQTLLQEKESYILRLDDEIEQIEQILVSMGWTEARRLTDHLPIYEITKLTVSSDAENRLRAMTWVRSFHRNREVSYRSTIPNDSAFNQQWHLEHIGAPLAWDLGTGHRTVEGDEIVLAVFDKGYDVSHPDLKDNIWIFEDEISLDEIDNDNNGYIDDRLGLEIFQENDQHTKSQHGSSVLGVMCARGNNQIGISGVSWDAQALLISHGIGVTRESHVIEALNYARRQRLLYNQSDGTKGAFVVAINLSLGFTGGTESAYRDLCDVIQSLGEVGILTVCAVPNADINIDVEGDIPALCSTPFIIAVTSSDQMDRKSSDAAYGLNHVDLAAPGEDILTTHIDGYGVESGTSIATPLVTGAIGVMYSAASREFVELIRQSPGQAALVLKNLLINAVHQRDELQGLVASSGVLDLSASCGHIHRYGQQVDLPLNIHTIGIAPTDRLSVRLSAPSNQEGRYWIVNRIGQIVQPAEFIFNLTSGESTIELVIDSMSEGVYVLIVEQNGQSTAQSFYWPGF